MHLKKLRLAGFKSFVEPAELRIEPGLTGVVGPNGCGKSNLLEAIRWVMGENSPKSMRGGGMEDVIFAGTATRPPRQFAEVSLLAEAAKGTAGPIGADDGEIEIVRRIQRGAGSAYRANGRDVRAKDVALLFADAATGAHSPALVSQGRIAAVIAAKPAERRMMLEEAAGIAGLHARRKDAEQKLRGAETNLQRVDLMLANMDVRANSLRRQAKAARRYKALSGEIAQAEARLIYVRWRDARRAADAARAEAQQAESVAKEAAKRREKLQIERHDAAKALEEARARHSHIRDDTARLDSSLASLKAERAQMGARLQDLQRQTEQIADDLTEEDKRARAALERLEDLRGWIAHSAGELTELEAERPEIEKALHAADRAARENELALAKARAELARIDADRQVALAAEAAAKRCLVEINTECERAESALAELPDVASLKHALSDAEQEISAQGAIVAEADAAGDAAHGERRAMAEQADRLAQTLSAHRSKLAGLRAEASAIEQALAAQKGGGNRAVDAVRASPGYETALAAALGDDLAAALDDGAVRYWSGADIDDAAGPHGAERLSHHVDAPAALGARLAQIWVVDTDDGQTLSLGQRLVTRDGRMRRWDGFTVTIAAAGDLAEQLVRRNRLADLQNLMATEIRAVEDAETQDALLSEQRQGVDAVIAQARDRLRAAEEAVRQAKREKDRLDGRIERSEGLAADLEQRLAANADRKVEADEQLRQARATLEDLPDDQALRTRTAELDAAGEALRQQLRTHQADLSALDQSIASTRERRAGLQADIRAHEGRKSEAEERQIALARRRKTTADQLATIADRPEALDTDIAELDRRRIAAGDALAGSEAALEDAAELLQQIESALGNAEETLSAAREERAGASARADSQDLRRMEMVRIASERFACPPQDLPQAHDFEPSEDLATPDASAQLDKLQAARERIGPVNLVADDELEALDLEIGTSRSEAAELTEAVHRLRGSIGSLNREGRQRLLAAFETVNGHFERLFATLFEGGAAHLELIESDDPLEAGLEILAQPPGKKLAALTLLSGGEQALTAVALIFGQFLTNPAPICVLDEVDAPLDDANIERFCDLLVRMTKETDTRYLIVTHNAVTMSRMDRLFGVTMMEQGVSRLVSVDLGAAEELLAAE
ncbi:chromosome segregation protein SMC [Novosphingopyxis baekryungensis]|uniref:chromosome segregation protein SMC n=1 Tax=Novosphingopyxis baekryungensis TaxID=279369 RepID=UPI0003B46B21|nr:chromosome segregation protein SMC [Novosphingopyxis baekryungensis]